MIRYMHFLVTRMRLKKAVSFHGSLWSTSLAPIAGPRPNTISAPLMNMAQVILTDVKTHICLSIDRNARCNEA